MPDLITSLSFWIALSQIVAVNFALSGNNGMVIALAARSLPPERRSRAIFWGIVAAVAIRVILTVIAFEMLQLPYMKMVGGALLFWIAVQLLVPEAGEDQTRSTSNSLFNSAAYRITLGNLAMSLDNVLSVAAAAADNGLMLALGLVVSILMITSGSALVTVVMARLPVIYTLCAGLIAYLAGNMLVDDVAIRDWVHGHPHWLQSTHFDQFRISVPGLIGLAMVFPVARLYQVVAGRRHEGDAAGSGHAPPSRSFRDFLKSMIARFTGYRILPLIPFALVVAVTYLGHPLYVHFGSRLVPQIRYSGLGLGMTPAEVIRARGYPEYVGEWVTNNERPSLRFAEIPSGKTAMDYREWEFPMGRSEPVRLEVVYSETTRLVTQISCYSERGYCPPVSEISTGASEDEVVKKLGEPGVVKVSGEFQTLDYPHLRLSLLLNRKRVVMLSVHEFEGVKSGAPATTSRH